VRGDPDFTTYVVARWQPVVRVLVVLGHPVERAEDVAVASFARLMPDWARLRREGDVDVELGRVVLDGWVRTREPKPAPRVPMAVPAARVMTRELEDQLAMLERLLDGVDRLDEATRATVALRHLGDLDTDQVADVLGEPRWEVERRLSDAAVALDLVPLDPACHSAATAIDVPPPAVSRVVATAQAASRRRWLVAGAVAAVLAVVAGVAFAATRPAPSTDPDALPVSPVENIVADPWWLDGDLHLDHGTVPVEDVSQLVATGVGVVYSDSDGKVTAISDDGLQETLGTLDPATPMVSQPRFGWVAWTEPRGGDLVVYDVITDREVGRLDATTDTHVIGWDRERLYYHHEGNDWAVTVNVGALTDPVQIARPLGAFSSVLLDVSSGALLRDNHGLDVVQPLFSLNQPIPGRSGQLSPDGNFALTHAGDGAPSLYDVRTGKEDGTWFDAKGWTPVAAAFTAEGRVVWVVDSHDGSYGLYECQASKDYINSMNPDAEPCSQRYDLDGIPILAGIEPGLAPTEG
jgi:DNA-directed RNA polymerase specialized sigma24 family protein